MNTLLLVVALALTAPSTQSQVCNIDLNPDFVSRIWERIHCWGTPDLERLCLVIEDDRGEVYSYSGPPQRYDLERNPAGQAGFYRSPTACAFIPVFGSPEDIRAQVLAYENGLATVLATNGSAAIPMPSRGDEITVEVKYRAYVGKLTDRGCEEAQIVSCVGSEIKIKISLW